MAAAATSATRRPSPPPGNRSTAAPEPPVRSPGGSFPGRPLESAALRRELRAFGIQVALIEPGAIRSEFSSTSMAYVDRYRSDSSPFASVYERAGQLAQAFERTAVGPECVAEAVEHAIRARRARPRYVVPLSSRFMMWVAGWLPTRWIDALMARARGSDASRPAGAREHGIGRELIEDRRARARAARGLLAAHLLPPLACLAKPLTIRLWRPRDAFVA